jgi:hypothetical protein
MDFRQQALQQWLAISHIPILDIKALPGDASFRRYFRVVTPNGLYIAMDAPPPTENCAPFVAIANGLRVLGLATPKIELSDLTNGFLLLSDFGDRVYLRELNSHNAEMLYGRALDALLKMQACRQIEGWTLAPFTAEFMRRELEMFKEWFLIKHLELTLSTHAEQQLAMCFDFLANSAAQQKQVFMHRDYHSANLMVLPDNQVGILDFQDAFIGPITYDLVSLLRDCYVSWPDALVNKLVLNYWENLQLPDVSADEFCRWFDLMGLQRHLKALLTFSRKFRRDGNSNYLQHIPRTLEYISKISQRYSECHFLNNFISQQVMSCVE